MRIALIAVVAVLLSSVAFALPEKPHQFYGTVTINGAPAADGTSIVAKINGIEVASTITKDNTYGYSPTFYVDDPNSNRAGKTIEFFVNDVNTGQTEIFANGKSTRIDLTATITTTTTTAPAAIDTTRRSRTKPSTSFLKRTRSK